MIRIRAVGHNTLISHAIDLHEVFWASHVEAVFADGYIGAHADGGVLLRPVGYDLQGMTKEQFFDISCFPAEEKQWEAYMRQSIGTPYDLAAILGFAVHKDLHEAGHVICSALVANGLQFCGRVKQWPIPTEEINPRDIVLIASALQ